MNFDEKEKQNMANNIIGERIAGLLREQGKTQRELAEQVGTTEVSMSRYIKGDRAPKGPILANIAKALHTTTDYLLGNEKDSNDPELEYNYTQRSIARNVMEWIPCTERLPEKSGRYLVTRGSNVCGSLWNKVDILNYSDLMGLKKEKIWWGGNVGKIDFEKYDHVIAWMPLPDPYKIFTDNEKVCNGCHYNDGGVHAECIVCDKKENRKEFGDEDDSTVPAHWIDQGHKIFKCSNCGNYLDFRGVNAGRGTANYCPNCGAKMERRRGVMNKYSEIEIQIANDLLKRGYKWLVRNMHGNVVAFSCRPCKFEGYWLWASDVESEGVSGKSTPIFQSIKWEDKEPTYIEDIINPQILDEAERQYLSAVIRPFRDQVRSITKNPKMNGKGEYIVIDIGFQLENRHKFFMFFPDFKSNTMYKGMELGKEYTLEELGL